MARQRRIFGRGKASPVTRKGAKEISDGGERVLEGEETLLLERKRFWEKMIDLLKGGRGKQSRYRRRRGRKVYTQKRKG